MCRADSCYMTFSCEYVLNCWSVDIRYSCLSSIPLGCCDWWYIGGIYLKNSQAGFDTLPWWFTNYRYVFLIQLMLPWNTRDVSVDKEKQFKFLKSSASGSGLRNFWRILQHCKIGHFPHCGHISGKLILSEWKFWNHPDPETWSRLWIWTGIALA